MRGLALKLLEGNEIEANSKNLLPTDGLNAAEALQQGQIDAAFIVAAPEAAVGRVAARHPMCSDGVWCRRHRASWGA